MIARSAGLLILVPALLSAGETISLVVHEDEGIRRFGYPVRVLLPESLRIEESTPFRLVHGSTAVRAQLRKDSRPGGARVWLDFTTSLLPNESLPHRLEYGVGVAQGPTREAGLTLSETEQEYVIANQHYLTWAVRKSLDGGVRSLLVGETEYLRPDARGLLIRDRDGRTHLFGAGDGGGKAIVTSRVLRSGPFAIGLLCERAEATPSLAGVRSRVGLDFVVSKSWVEIDWTVEDPGDRVDALGMEIALAIAKPSGRDRTLVDFGAGSFVYISLGDGEEAELRAEASNDGESSWEVLRGRARELEPFVASPRGSPKATRAEGWAHLMDQSKCVAAAVHRFAESTRDRIHVSADGTLTIWREWENGGNQPAPKTKRLRFWFHFVPFPPHVTAATSPQSMQSPLRVEFVKPGADK